MKKVSDVEACSGRNYNFRCINVGFWRVLRETALTAAKSRTNLSTNSGKLSNGWADWNKIWHTCADSSGNVYTPNKLPLETQGALGDFYGVNN